VVKEGRAVATACVTSDYLPTVMAVFGESYEERPLDGESILPLIKGEPFQRKKTIGFKFQARSAWNDDRYKLYADRWGDRVELYDLKEDPGEKKDLAAEKPDQVRQMLDQYRGWERSVRGSFEGKEYGTKSFQRLKQEWPGRRRR
jgi:arylsulfatase A-like enzyme